ncbi:MAG TPA: Fe-S cluster assembly protein SufB [Candidatus Nanoarchaeia archaeon]|nr:Fe-S cluster assembly protein SufB [Candidatus Nanoarchaeia archaeon]
MLKAEQNFEKDYSKYGFSDKEDYAFKSKKGLSKELVEEISKMKGEPEWMLNIRLKALEEFYRRPMPQWGANLNVIDFEDIYYYIKPKGRSEDSWEDVPAYIKDTFNKLGIPEAEQKFLGGVGAQYESELVYHKIRKDLEDKGVIFLGMDDGLKKYPEIVKKYFCTVIPHNDNKLAALNTAVWSGGSFVYVPKGVKVDLPLQAYFRINAKNAGQFERTLIIAEEGSSVHYIEGCTAPTYSSDSLHSAVVELIALKGSRIQYTTIQNWSNNVYNLVTKRAFAYEDATVFWVDGNLGSKITMKYPSIYLLGEHARAEILSVAFAGKGQTQDAGGKILHFASNTSSRITSKSVSKDGGKTTYRGLLHVAEGCKNVKSHVTCDALILDDKSASDTVPYMEINEKDVNIEHEATVGKIGEEQLFYLMSRGLSEDQARTMIVSGFMEPFTKELPLEYAIELNRLIAMSMEGSVG